MLSLAVFAGYDNEALIARARALAIPIVDITTVDSVFPTCEAVYPPQGCDGIGITNNDKVQGRMLITIGNDTLYNSGPYVEDQSGLTIRVRGNTTAANQLKFPYKIKLQSKADLLMRGNDEKYRDKDWVLLNSRCYETLAGKLTNRSTEMPWTPDNRLVFVILNGDFRGQYLLSENIKRNPKCRIDISKEGYIFEYDPYWWNESYTIPSENFRYYYTLKYPSEEDILPYQADYLSQVIAAMEQQMAAESDTTDLLDLRSFARWLLVHDILGDCDYAGSNMYFTKYDTLDSPVQMGPAWDFGGCFTEALQGSWATVHNQWWFATLFAQESQAFASQYVQLYDSVGHDAFSAVIRDLSELLCSPTISTLDSATLIDNTRWWPEYQPASAQLGRMISYLVGRQVWMDGAIEEMRLSLPEPRPDGLEETQAEQQRQTKKVIRNGQLLILKEGKTYTLTGELIIDN